MRINNDATPKYSYCDVTIKPAVVSSIRHRGECYPMGDNGKLPLFTAPMDTVVNEFNYKTFLENNITPIIPRTVNIEKRLEILNEGIWVAFSLAEFEQHFTGNNHIERKDEIKYNVLIDVANGHMQALYDDAKAANEIYGDRICLMLGNIANPETYRTAFEADIQYIRVGIGAGAGCITASNTAVHYPMASLISEVAAVKEEIRSTGVCGCRLPKIVADGGVRNYSDIIKALALGADYVMCGSIFAKMLESAAPKNIEWEKIGDTVNAGGSFEQIYKRDGLWYGIYSDEYINKKNEEITDEDKKLTKAEVPIGKITAKFYGMASKAGQIALSGEKKRTSEGIEKTIEVDYTMGQWCTNFADYLMSAMSYTDSRNLFEFRNKAEIVIISNNTYNSVNK